MLNQKHTHLVQIIATGLLGDASISQFQVPNPDTVQQYGSLMLQALVTAVTVFAALKKAFQKPVKAETPAPNASPA